MSKIETATQYFEALRWIERFSAAVEYFEKKYPEPRTKLQQAEIDGLQSKILDLTEQRWTFEDLFRRNKIMSKQLPEALRKLFLENPTVHAGLSYYLYSDIPLQAALIGIIIALAEENTALRNELIKILSEQDIVRFRRKAVKGRNT